MAGLWDVTKPANAIYTLTGQLGIRNNWKALIKTIGQDHWPMGYDEPDGPNAGSHKQLSLYEISTPGNVANTGFAYTKDDGGDTECHYEDESANETQITEDAKVIRAVPLFAYLNFQGNVDNGTYTSTDSAFRTSNNVAQVVKSDTLGIYNFAVTFSSALPASWCVINGISSGERMFFSESPAGTFNFGIYAPVYFEMFVYGG